MENKQKQGILETKTIYTALRPPRAAVFVNIKDKDWKKTMIHIIELLSTIWGGDGFIVVPTDGKTINPYFKELLKTYDPDLLLSYELTGYDLKENDPVEFKNIIDSRTKLFTEQHPDTSDEKQTRKEFEEQLLHSPLYAPINVSGELKQFIKKELVVFHFRDRYILNSLNYSGNIPHNLPKLVDVLSGYMQKKDLKLVELDLSNHNINYQLIGYGSTGKADLLKTKIQEEINSLKDLFKRAEIYDPDYAIELQKKIVTFEKFKNSHTESFKRSDTSIMLKSFWNRKIDIDGMSFRELWRKQLKKKYKSPKVYNYFSRLPFPIANIGLSHFFKRKDYLKMEYDYPLLIVGDTIEDYCLYYSLVRLRNKVFWIPYTTLRNDSRTPKAGNHSFYLIHELRDSAKETDNKSVFYTSVSLSESSLQKIPDLLDKNDLILSHSFGKLKDKMGRVSQDQKLLPYFFRVYEVGNANNYFAYQFLDGVGISYVDTPKPKTFPATDPIRHKWIAEINIKDYAYPSAEFLSEMVFSSENMNAFHLSTTATRVTDSGIHYQCPAMGFVSSNEDVNDRLVRPKLKIVTPFEIFQEYFKREKYEIRPSDKGSYFLQVLSKFSTFIELIQIIRNRDNFSLFELFMDATNTPSVYTKGAFVEKRRYIDLASVENLLGSKEKAIDTIESLLALNLLERGFLFKCELCKHDAWYRTTEAEKTFTCKRCSNKNFISKVHLRLQDPDSRYEPIFFYKLDELFYQFWNNNGHITILTLQKLKEDSDGSLLFIPETEFRRNPESSLADFEIDILAVVDGLLFLGEAKKDANSSDIKNKLKVDQINKLISITKSLPLRGLIFTSWSGNWPDDVKTKLEELRNEGKYIIHTFSKDDILPPIS